jgi:sulfur relay (sulfurtransferase) DsrF/TusC family protein
MSDQTQTATGTATPAYCLLVRSPPYGTSMPAEAYRVVQALYAYDHPVTVALMDDGVLSLVKGADPTGIGMRSLSRAFADLAGLKNVHVAVHRGSLEDRGLTEADIESAPEGAPPIAILGTGELEALLAAHKAILRF